MDQNLNLIKFLDIKDEEIFVDKSKIPIINMQPWSSGFTLERYIGSLVYSTYRDQKYHSRTRGHGLPKYTEVELLDWFLKQPHLVKLTQAWINSGFKKNLRPSVDRLNDKIGYALDNIQLMTWNENRAKHIIQTKYPVEVYLAPPSGTEPMILYMEFPSAAECTKYMKKTYKSLYDIKKLFTHHRIISNNYLSVLPEFLFVYKDDKNKQSTLVTQLIKIRNANDRSVLRIDVVNNTITKYDTPQIAGLAIYKETINKPNPTAVELKSRAGNVTRAILKKNTYAGYMWAKESTCTKEYIEELKAIYHASKRQRDIVKK